MITNPGQCGSETKSGAHRIPMKVGGNCTTSPVKGHLLEGMSTAGEERRGAIVLEDVSEGLRGGNKDVTTNTVNKSLRSVMTATGESRQGVASSDRDTECIMNSENRCLRYDMTQLGEYVSILEFDMKQRYYRFSDSYCDGHHAKVIGKIRVMVLIDF